MKLHAILAVGLTSLAVSNASAPAADQNTPPPAKAITVSASRLEDVAVAAPDGAPTALVVYLSDKSGWQPSDDKIVDALRMSWHPDHARRIATANEAVTAARRSGDPTTLLFAILRPGGALRLRHAGHGRAGVRQFR